MKKEATTTIGVKIPQNLLQAVNNIADHDMLTVSDVVRQSLLKEVRARGLLTVEKTA